MVETANRSIYEGIPSMKQFRCAGLAFAMIATILLGAAAAFAQQDPAKDRPWMNTSLSPDERAEMALTQLTLDEKIGLVPGEAWPGWGTAATPPPPNRGEVNAVGTLSGRAVGSDRGGRRSCASG